MSTSRFIARVSYRSNHRVARTYVKLQYGAAFDLAEKLMRLWAMGQIDWFRIDTIKPGEITPEIRSSLQRWPQALEATAERTKVQLSA